jgi:hypothetical protein
MNQARKTGEDIPFLGRDISADTLGTIAPGSDAKQTKE